MKFSRSGIDTGIGADLALAQVLRAAGIGTGLGADRASVSHLSERTADTGVGTDLAMPTPRLYVAESGLGADLARPGVRPFEAATGSDGARLPRLAELARDTGLGADMLTATRLRTPATESAAGADSAACGFTAHAAVTTPYTLAGTYTYVIPVWCRYIDVVLLGPGGGGASSGTFYTLKGYPGEAGVYATFTLERGVHIPWTATAITIVVGAGGARGSGGFTGTPGSAGPPSTAAAAGWAGLSAASGAGGIANATGTSDNVGRSPGNLNYNGQLYTGGATQSTNGAAGNPPGGGGAGGSNFGGAGGVGAPGGAWCRAYQ
ncbi:hypothetical protein A5784_35210 [Mycobacterium sp. 852013-50091_SCH5140682]|nr:hypothetical protein A5784_35210 [Mycobacterium sp. 852013-50091_SCH5140682]